ncbi:uncharacterized protein LOC107421017 isoform X2 [Ziziphus jujuba]|uniref:Uncharacterized protein LOC107421017 isoform X1 n=1 Tax=Ziziphus jujuba TaxID=326968 RepID=A0A6P6G8U5_ZIZJJ|nr:uncharacterized protein LOC107421017 isoform X1 [Ziziphus jujuba]XP_024930548.3 uncharacterized protein LOC107421017 isoform X2 [Ziziphus jujuba]
MSSQDKSSPALLVGGSRSGSFSRTSSTASSIRRRSFSLSGALPSQRDDDVESETVSEAGDIGDRALQSNRYSESGSFGFSFDHAPENGVVVTIPEHGQLQSRGGDPAGSNAVSPVSPLPNEIISPLSTDAMVQSEDKIQDNKKQLPKLLEYGSCLTHLAVFGILGVLTRHLLQKLFGPGVAKVTSNESILYLDLPSNMVGSFLMGWFGVVFKGDISRVSDFLAIGLTTGYLGSLTTFSGWNQKMIELSVEGQWVEAVLGFLIGLFLAAYSIIFGVETAKGFRYLLEKRIKHLEGGIPVSNSSWRVDSCRRHLVVMAVFILTLGLLWSVSVILEKKEFSSGSSEAELWLGCIVGPLGVWMRWFLARLNGRGLGKTGLLKWIPFGTLIANVSAACVMAALATIKKAVNTKNCDTIATGIQFGFLGCLSTVSTFIAEFNAMRESKHPWRAYAYAMITVCISFGLGTLIYSVPVWTEGYN